ncbi:Uncharacterised protein [uncultured archaeon]|nr:Uncharacterised protein [uncultured archaeon]
MVEEEGRKGFRLGATLGAIGIVILILNVGDFLLGWQRVADWTALIGMALALSGAYLEFVAEHK